MKQMASATEHNECGSGEFCPTCNPITCSGFLHQRLRFGRWKRRWFKLYGKGTMMIYDTESSSVPVDTVDIKSNCLDIHVGVRPGRFPSWVPVPCTFVISLRNKKLFLYANSVSDSLQWVKALRKASENFKTSQKEIEEIDRRLANLQESGAEATQGVWSRSDHVAEVPLPPPLPAVLPVMQTTDNLAEEDDITVSTRGSLGTDQETSRKPPLPASFSRDRDSSNRKRKEALRYIVRKKEAESQFTEKGVCEAPLNERPASSAPMHQVEASGSHGDDRQTPVMERFCISPVLGEPLDCQQTTARGEEIKTSEPHRPKANKCDRSTSTEDCSVKHKKEMGVTRKRAIKFRPWSAQPPLEPFLKRESPIGASKTSLNVNEESDAKLHITSRLQSMETFNSLNFSAEPQPFRSQSCAGFIHRIKDASAPERSTPSPSVSARFTPQPYAMIRLDRIRAARKKPSPPKPATHRTAHVTFSEITTTYAPLEIPDDASPGADNAEGRSWWHDPDCVPSKHHSPTREGAMKGRSGMDTWKHYRKHPTMESEISKVWIGKHLLLIEVLCES